MLALEIIKPDENKTPDGVLAMKILESALEMGVLGYMAGPEGEVVRFIPPLTVNEDQINQSLEILEVCLQKLS